MNKTIDALKLAEEALVRANHFHDYEDELAAIREALAEPVDVKAIRAEALEEAAEQCDRIASNGSFDAEDCAAAIRNLK